MLPRSLRYAARRSKCSWVGRSCWQGGRQFFYIWCVACALTLKYGLAACEFGPRVTPARRTWVLSHGLNSEKSRRSRRSRVGAEVRARMLLHTATRKGVNECEKDLFFFAR